jgi:hypothetical protein
MKELKKFNTRFEADNFAIVLDQHNIPYIIQSADSGGLRPAFVVATIIVSEEDYQKARALLEE